MFHRSNTTDLIIPGVHIQKEKSVFDNIELKSPNIVSSIDLVEWAAVGVLHILELKGMEKKDSKSRDVFTHVHKLFIKNVLGDQPRLPKDYNYFGDDNSAANLPEFLRTNPFFASALIASVNAGGEVEFNISSRTIVPSQPESSDANWFRRLVDCLADNYTRVDAKFDKNMKLIHILRYQTVHQNPVVIPIFEWSEGQTTSVDEQALKDASAQLLYLLGFYAQCIHALIHVLHYMLDCAIVGATEHSKDMHCWAQPYLPNVALKYTEVTILLLGNGGDLTGGLYRANHHPVPDVLRDMLKVWLHCETGDAFIRNFLLVDVLSHISDAQWADTKLLEAYYSQAKLAGPYATELTNAFEASQEHSLDPANKEIAAFFADTSGRDDQMSSIKTLNSWIQLYSVTGILHGATLSFSRLLCTHPIVSLHHNGLDFSGDDTKAFINVSGTITGVIHEHHVFSNKMHASFLHLHHFNSQVDTVITRYAAATATLKEAHLAELLAKPEYFKRFGWIVSDYCPDGVDGKQLTLCTYI